ncbi:MAG: HD domain-containing protein [Actinomycetota bacterium]|nr:HD domain-containing protein [Actinomycetota bacterium]
MAAAVAAAALTGRLLPRPAGGLSTVVWWLAVMAASTLALLLVERQARRLLPLVTLFRLTLVFPDKAPSRLRVALRAGTVRNLEQRLEQGRRDGAGDDPSQAASNILMLVAALTRHDRRTRGHSERVRGFTDLIAEEMHLSPDEGARLRWAALLHDIGKVRVPTKILNKEGALAADEWAAIHRHPADGARMAAPLRAWLGPSIDAIEQHHERWDGGGYPRGLAGADISRSARIVAVADAYEVMTAPRSYRRPLGPAAARDELARCAGSHFDPMVVRAFLNVSIGRVRWVLAPIAWLADLSVVRPVAQAGTAMEGAASAMAVKTFAAVSLAVVGGTVGELPPPAPPPLGLSSVQPERGPKPLTPPSAATGPDGAPLGGALSASSGGVGVGGGPGAASTAPTAVTRPAPPGGVGKAAAVAGAPTLMDDELTVRGARSRRIDVLANDSGPHGLDRKSLTVIRGPDHGDAQVTGEGGYIRYQPDHGDDFKGVDSFQYEICDNRGVCSVATVRVTTLSD